MPFTNRNQSRNFAQAVTNSGWVEMAANGTSKGAGGAGMECSQVLVSHAVTNGVYFRDRWDTNDDFTSSIFVPPNVPTVITGITNVNELSAKGGASGTVYYRTAFYDGITLTG